MKIIDTAIRNYHALPPQKQMETKAAFTGIGMFLLYIGYEAVTDGWRKALGIFLAVTIFCTVATLATWFGMVLGKVIGQKVGMAVSVTLIFAFIALVLYLIGSNWG